MHNKLHILKSVTVFADAPDDVLADVVDRLDEIEYKAGDVVFSKGEIGTCMYIVAEGKVRVHDEDREIRVLGERQVFGEMSALDPEPRSASVTALEDTVLLRLDQEPVYDLIARRVEIARGIIHILCQHLRSDNRAMIEDYHYIQQVGRITAAAAAIESGVYEPESLNEVTQRSDALGQLARVFQSMMREVYAREQRLLQQVAALRIEIDETKKAREVAEIVNTDYFASLQQKAQEFRSSRAGPSS